MNVLITGAPGAGKSTAASLLATKYGITHGFVTNKRTIDSVPHILFRMLDEPEHSSLTLAVWNGGGMTCFKPAFDEAALRISTLSSSSDIIMDELGWLELCSPDFCCAALELLRRSQNVVACIKPMSNPFLNDVRACADTRLFTISPDSRHTTFAAMDEYWAMYCLNSQDEL